MRPSTIPLDAFDLTEVVGRGSAGSVWRARHRQPNGEGTALAIKLLTGAHARSDSGAAAFRREVRAVAALDHPHIVRIYEHGQVGSLSPFPQEEDIPSGSPYLAMDLLEGGTLTSRAGRLDWPDLKGVLLALLDGLGHAHARGVLHRDIKPSNIMLGPTGLTITDFGLSYRPDEGGSAVEQLAGTPAYMAPEQFSGNWRDFGSWTDLYAVGCTAFALACARPPYGARMTPAASMEGHLYGRLPQVKSYRAVPTGFEAWIHRLIQKAPRDRFRLAAEAAHELRKLDPSSHRAPTRPEATNSFPDHRHDEDERALRPRIAGLGLGLYGLRTPRLTGRANERDVLWAALAEVHRSRSVQVRVISGGAGTGKSRLAEWIGERAMERGVELALRVVHSPRKGLLGVAADELPAKIVGRRPSRGATSRLRRCAGWTERPSRCSSPHSPPLRGRSSGRGNRLRGDRSRGLHRTRLGKAGGGAPR